MTTDDFTPFSNGIYDRDDPTISEEKVDNEKVAKRTYSSYDEPGPQIKEVPPEKRPY